MMPTKICQGKAKGNPKMHKDNIPMRTIISSINHPTERVAEVAEQELNEGIENLPSYIKDTTDFLQKIGRIQRKPTLNRDSNVCHGC